jgi:predicted small lipoprotein YifL
MTGRARRLQPPARPGRRAWLLLLAACALAACGRKGDLYLPDGQSGPSQPESTELPPQHSDGMEDRGLP